jgi:hypothetical protein
VEGAETKGKKKRRKIEPGLQIVWFTENLQTEKSFGKGHNGWPPTSQRGGRSLYHARQMCTMAILDLPGLSQKILTCPMPFKKHFVCQWPIHNAWLPDLVTCLSCKVWDACQSPDRQNCSYEQDGWITSRWISTASLSLILNIPMSI